MRLWLKVRRAPACVATIVGVTAAALAVSPLLLPIPNLLSGLGIAVPISFVVPLAVAVAVGWALQSGDQMLEAVAARPLRVLDALYAVMLGVLALGTGAAVAEAFESPLVLGAGRNALGYVGMTLIGRQVVGGYAAPLVPAAFVVLAAMLGGGASSQPRWWAWPLAESGATTSWVIAWLLILIGGVLTLRPTRAILTS